MNASSNKARIYKILILVTILAVPGFLYYLLQDKGENRYRPLPIYGPKQVAGTSHSVRGKEVPDTIYHTLKDFRMVNQDNDTVNLDTWKGKVVIVHLFYTQSPTKGNKVALRTLQTLNKAYQANQMVRLASISVDEEDSAEKLADFAKTISANSSTWSLLRGDSASIYPFIRQELLLDVAATSDKKIVHSNKIVLLDTQHRIRGFYEATDYEATSKLEDEVKVLIAEELRNMKDGR